MATLRKENMPPKKTEPAKEPKPRNDNKPAPAAVIDPVALGNILMDVSQRGQPLLQEFFKKHESL